MAIEPNQRSASTDPNGTYTPSVDALNPGSAPEASQPSSKTKKVDIASPVAENVPAGKLVLISTSAAPIKLRLTDNTETIIPPFGKTGEVQARLVPETLPSGVVALAAPSAKKE